MIDKTSILETLSKYMKSCKSSTQSLLSSNCDCFSDNISCTRCPLNKTSTIVYSNANASCAKLAEDYFKLDGKDSTNMLIRCMQHKMMMDVLQYDIDSKLDKQIEKSLRKSSKESKRGKK